MSPVVRALGVQRDHVARQAVEPAGALGDGDRFEAGVAVPGHRQLDIADLGGDRLGVDAVAAVARPAARRVVALITEMVGHLDLEAGLENLAHQPRQQAALASQVHPLLPGTRHEQFGPLAHRCLSLTAGTLRAGTTDISPLGCLVVMAMILHGPRHSAVDPQITPLTQSS
jgi:hypothetical protein